ncbi:glycoside hydrolase [Auricularia subglabra TFB-10046 SS5]|nr:glycoside hydrolase [Auricularia subglabra TFB-10046 SS5]
MAEHHGHQYPPYGGGYSNGGGGGGGGYAQQSYGSSQYSNYQQPPPHPQSPGYYDQPPPGPYGGGPYGAQQGYGGYDQYGAYSSDTLAAPRMDEVRGSGEMLHPRRAFADGRTDSFSSYNTYVGQQGGGAGGGGQGSPLIKPAAYYDNPAGAASRDELGGHPEYDPTPVFTPPPKKSKRGVWFILLAVLVVLGAAGACVYFFVIKPKQDGDGTASGGGSKGNSSSTPPGTKKLIVGRNGDEVTMEDGSKFVYKNEFGGYFIDDPENPYNNGARAQQWSRALNESWDYGNDIIRGVNLGGWLVLEPFISPALYEKYMDGALVQQDGSEWTLTQAMRADRTPGGGIEQLLNHYKTFITEKDFADIAGAGLNWIRLPIPYWAIDVWEGEPFEPRVAWDYCLKAFKWARKYGLRINLDLHTMPGSQNGWNHSGKVGAINWMSGVMGVANAQRSLDYMRIITEFISQPEYKDLIPMFGIVNEPTIDQVYLEQFYLQAYTMIRGITGYGAGNGPIISIHDHFNTGGWGGVLSGADRIALDVHNYFAFDGRDKPTIDQFIDQPCLQWGNAVNASLRTFGITAGGEWSLGYNDCGMFVNEGLRDVQHTTNCDTFWDNWQAYPQATKDQLKLFALSSMEGMRNFFFWTWKIGPSLRTGRVQAPLWSYSLGLENGWMPTDPREAIGHCASRGVAIDPAQAFNGVLAPTATGAPGAPRTIDPASLATVRPWPPTQLGQVAGDGIAFPTYTPTGTINTLPPPTGTPKLTGWTNPQDTTPVAVPIAGCTYPDPWTNPAAPVPPPCT